MRVRVRTITTRASGAKAVREDACDVGRLRIGRSTSNDVELRGLTVSLDHAVVERREGGTWIEALGDACVLVNGHVTGERRLEHDDVVRIGSYDLRFADGDDELVVEVESVAAAGVRAAGLYERSRLTVAQSLPSLRVLSWLAALAAAAVFFGPLVVGRETRGEQLAALRSPETAGEAAGARASLARFAAFDRVDASLLWRPVSRLRADWSPGALSRAHAYMEDRCEVCHAEPYAPVGDRACLDCHAGVGAHAASAVSLDTGSRDACSTCHREHGGAAGATTYSDEACTTCHASLSAHDSRTLLVDVASWSEHPHFRPSVVVEARLSRRERVPLTSEGLEGGAVERSGLIFPHRDHVFPGPLGKVMLACETCHTADAAGAGMRPIRFAEHCQSCHPLLFDERHPQHQAPHVEPARVAESLDVFYAWLALNGLARDPEAPPPARRRPAKEMTETERAGALQWARASAQRAGRRLLTGSCTTCHFVERDAQPAAAPPPGAQPAAARLDAVSASGDSPTIDDAAAQPPAAEAAAPNGTPHATLSIDEHVVIAPVRVVPLEQSDAWLPLANFSHGAHGDVDCEHCHDVRYVRNAEAVVLPAIDTCRQCHAAEASAGKVGSPCVSCHGFHRDSRGKVSEGVHASAAGAIDATVAR